MEPRQDEKLIPDEKKREPRQEPKERRFQIVPLEERLAPGITRVGTD